MLLVPVAGGGAEGVPGVCWLEPEPGPEAGGVGLEDPGVPGAVGLAGGGEVGEGCGVWGLCPEPIGPLEALRVGLSLPFRLVPAEALDPFAPGLVPGKDGPALGPVLFPGPPRPAGPESFEPPGVPHDPLLPPRPEDAAPPRLEAMDRETAAPVPAATAAPAMLGPPPNWKSPAGITGMSLKIAAGANNTAISTMAVTARLTAVERTLLASEVRTS